MLKMKICQQKKERPQHKRRSFSTVLTRDFPSIALKTRLIKALDYCLFPHVNEIRSQVAFPQRRRVYRLGTLWAARDAPLN